MLLNVQGREAYCYTGGKAFDPALPTVVFIHGAQNDHSVWVLQTRYFAHHGFGVLAVDLPGHSYSQGTPLTNIEAMAGWLLALLNAAGVQKAALVGHSMGSLIALEAASLAPARIDRLALLGTAYPMRVSDALLDAALNNEQRAIDMASLWQHSSIAQKPSNPGPGFYTMGVARRLMQHVARRNTEKVLHIDFSACNTYANGETAAKSVICPTLLLLGKCDVMTPPKASSLLANTIPDVRVEKLENCGHALMAEQPDAVLASLLAFIRCTQGT